jgi:hypothetical protein
LILGFASSAKNNEPDYFLISIFSSHKYSNELINIKILPSDLQVLDHIFEIILRFVKEKIIRTNIITPQELKVISYYDSYETTLNEAEKRDKYITEMCFNSFFFDTEYKISEIKEWGEKIEVYREELKRHYTNYNFVCLSKAFANMLTDKQKELRWQKLSLWLLGPFAFAIPMLVYFLGISQNIPPTAERLLTYLPLLAAEILLIYYFRINLQLFYNTKSQILQIELRRTLCAFAEGYTEYKKDKKELLPDKFETLIFSPIAASSDKIPSTFDGFDQLTKLVKECTRK